MADQKARSGSFRETRRRARTAKGAAGSTTTFLFGSNLKLPKGTKGIKLKVSEMASKALASSPKRTGALLQVFGEAISKSKKAGRPVSFRVEVGPDGETIHTVLEDVITTSVPVQPEADEQHADIEAALAAARARGRVHAAEILSGSEMLSADEFAKVLGTSRVTVNAKRQKGQVLGLDGAKRGFRFPKWQLNSEGKPYAELEQLQYLLGGPWAVYRFLVQRHGELNGLTGLQALEDGKPDAAIEAAKSIGRDFQ